MERFKIPDGYSAPLTIRETEVAIKEVKDHFERAISAFNPRLRTSFCPSGIRYERQLKRCRTPGLLRHQRAG